MAGGGRSTRNLDMGGITKDDLDRDFLGKLGLRPFRPKVPADLGRVLPGSVAERAGLARGDRVISVGGKPIATWFDFTTEISASAGKSLVLVVEREGRRYEVRATPEPAGEGRRVGRLGVEAGDSPRARVRAHDHDGALRRARACHAPPTRSGTCRSSA